MYVAARIDEAKCIGCKLCIFTCPDPNVIAFKKNEKKIAVDESRCKGCGLCVEICPKEALELS